MAVIKSKKEKKGRTQAEKPAPTQKGKKVKTIKGSPSEDTPKGAVVEEIRRGTLKRDVAKKDVAKKDVVKKEAAKKSLDPGRLIRTVRQFFAGTWQEMKKVHWPTRRMVAIYTAVVLVVVAIVMVIIWIADSIFSRVLQFIIKS
ncbi:MAG: preprotein translocase subunit SecE [Bacillota bacterium]